MTVGVGIVGCGGMGSWHASNVAAQAGVTVVAVADVATEAAEVVGARVAARTVDPAELVAQDDVDAVLIASNDESHAEFAVAAIDAGKFCFLEKPIGATVEDAQSVVDAEVAHGSRLTRVGFMRE
ncbi:MAG: Gfo/Idh/MocA family oxidoreductase, partial [Acidimicrobiales bacterium]